MAEARARQPAPSQVEGLALLPSWQLQVGRALVKLARCAWHRAMWVQRILAKRWAVRKVPLANKSEESGTSDCASRARWACVLITLRILGHEWHGASVVSQNRIVRPPATTVVVVETCCPWLAPPALHACTSGLGWGTEAPYNLHAVWAMFTRHCGCGNLLGCLVPQLGSARCLVQHCWKKSTFPYHHACSGAGEPRMQNELDGRLCLQALLSIAWVKVLRPPHAARPQNKHCSSFGEICRDTRVHEPQDE